MRDRSSTRNREHGAKSPSPDRRTHSRSLSVLVLLMVIAVAVTLLAHWSALGARALSVDDDQYLTSNPLVHHPSWASAGRFLGEVLHPSTVDGYYQPLAMISLMLDEAMAADADDLRPFHRTSLILHAANTALLVVLLYLLLANPWAAAMAGLLFGVHPMTVEAIPWIGERKTLLATFFALGSLIAYLRYARRPGWRPYLACAILYVLSLMSKPTSTPLPVVMLLLDFWPLRCLRPAPASDLPPSASTGRVVLEKVPLLIVAVVFSLITIVSQSRTAGVDVPGGDTLARPFLIISHNIVFYLYKMLWPVGLCSFYGFPRPFSLANPMVCAGAIGSCLLLVALAISLRWTRALFTGWLIFFVALMPAMGVLGFTMVIASDKYAYLPAVGLLLILAWLFDRIGWGSAQAPGPWRRAAVGLAVVVWALLLTIDTRGQLTHWQTTRALCDYNLRVAPDAFTFYHLRGNIRGADRDFDGAIEDYTMAIRIEPRFAEAYSNRASALIEQHRYEQAIQDCTTAIAIKPDYAAAFSNRGAALMSLGALDQAIRDCDRAIELRPGLANAYVNRGTVRGRQGDYDGAALDLTVAIELNPADALAYRNRGNACLGKGDFAGAVRDFSKAVSLRPAFAEAYYARAAAYARLKQYDRAWADVRTFQRLGGTPNPDFVKSLTEARGASR